MCTNRRIIEIQSEDLPSKVITYTILDMIKKSSNKRTVDIIHYQLDNIIDSDLRTYLSMIDYKTYSVYNQLSLDDLDEQITEIYNDYKNIDNEYFDSDGVMLPIVIIIEGIMNVDDIDTIEAFDKFIEDKITLLNFMNINIIKII